MGSHMQHKDNIQSSAEGRQTLEVCLGEDTVTLKLNGSLTLTAQQLHDMISSLALVRARMQPPVPPEPPEVNGTEFALNPQVAVMADPPGENILSFIRHPMYGWIGMAQSQEDAMRMVMALAEQLKLLEEDQPPTWVH